MHFTSTRLVLSELHCKQDPPVSNLGETNCVLMSSVLVLGETKSVLESIALGDYYLQYVPWKTDWGNVIYNTFATLFIPVVTIYSFQTFTP